MLRVEARLVVFCRCTIKKKTVFVREPLLGGEWVVLYEVTNSWGLNKHFYRNGKEDRE